MIERGRWSRSAVFFSLLLGFAGVGCGGPAPKPAETGAAEHLRKIGQAYDNALVKGRPPRNAEQFKPLLREVIGGKDPDEYFRSPNDGEPYEVAWGVRPDLIGEDYGAVLAHEKKGKDGKRFLITVAKITMEVTDEQFSQMHYPGAPGSDD